MTALAAVELSDVAAFIRGNTFKPEDVVPVDTPGAAACMRTKNVQTELDLCDVWGIPQSFVRREDQYLIPGDVLVSSANSWNLVGKCCLVPSLPWRSTFGGFISVLRANPAKVDPRYLFRWFASDRTQATVRSFGQQTTNISNLNVGRCLKLKLHLPALPEQRRIAEILDKADALRAKRRAALAQLDALTQSIFLDMFGDPATNPKGWPCAQLCTLGTKFSDGPFGSNLKSDHYRASGVRVVRLQNIGVGEFLGADAAYISEDHFRNLKKHECLPGDVLVGTLGDPNLRACIQPRWLSVALNKADCVQIRPDERTATSEFVCFLLNQPGTQRMAQDLMHGQTRIRISMGRLRSLAIPVPPIGLQRDFTQQVAAMETLKTAHRAALAQLDALFASLQHRAFLGDL